QHLRHLLRSGDAHIGDYAAMQGFRIIKIDDVFGEISAVAGDGAEVRLVRRCVQLADQGKILRRRGRDLEAVNGAVVRRADQFVPVSARSFAGSFAVLVGDYVFQTSAAVTVTQRRDHLRVGE